MASAATGLGVTLAELRGAKKLGAPGFKASRVYVSELLPWLKKHRGELAKSGETRTELECRKLQVQCERLEHELALKRGEFVSREKVVGVLQTIASSIRGLLNQKLENEYPAALAGMGVAEARIYGKSLNDAICVEFQRMGTAFEKLDE